MHTKRSGAYHRRTAIALGSLLLAVAAPSVSHAEEGPAPANVLPGPVVMWGAPTEMRDVLSPPEGLDDAVAIAASDTPGSYTNLALKSDGTVLGWGLNRFGEGTPPAHLDNVRAIDTGAGFSLALTADGSVIAWGDDESGQLDVPPDLGAVTAISAGGYFGYRGLGVPEAACGFALALRPDGTVVRWGQDRPGLGCTLIDARMDPPEGLDEVVAISAGSNQALALRADGTVVAWGHGASPYFDGTHPSRWTDIVAISAGSGNSLGLRSDGTVLAYGIWGESGPPSVDDVAAISASRRDVFLHVDSSVSTYPATWPPSEPTDPGIQAVAAGYDYSLAIGAPTLPPDPILGSADIQPFVDSNRAGTAEAFHYIAAGTGAATELNLYVDESNEARRIAVGVYADRAGRPGRLLARGRLTNVTNGEWNTIPINTIQVAAGEEYWIALMSPRRAGTLRFRDLPDGDGGPTSLSHGMGMRRDLPHRWRAGHAFANSPASAYLR